jgi:hypothetical protein
MDEPLRIVVAIGITLGVAALALAHPQRLTNSHGEWECRERSKQD